MNILTILLFFVYMYGLGFSVTFFLNNSKNFFERNLMRIGIGLGLFIVLSVFLNFLSIPLDWKIFLLLSLIIPILLFFNNKNKILFDKSFFKLTKSNLYIIIVLVIFLISLNMYLGGAFKYSYLEDDDPWDHALAVKYISIEKTVNDPLNYDFQYIDPYPPGYDLLLGVLHQTSPSINWTLKFFNALIISLGIIFFYFFAKIFTGNKNIALFSTFVLAAIPSFFTHFIWAHSLAIILFFPAMYCLEMIKNDKKWMYASMLLIASIILTQPTQAIKILIMWGIYWLIKLIVEKNINQEVLFSFLGSFLISLIWWATRWKPFLLSQAKESAVGSSSNLISKIVSAFPYDGGTATRAYTLKDFFIAQPYGGINVHLGWGIAISLLFVLGLLYCAFRYRDIIKKENVWIIVTIFWFIFTFLGTNSMTFNLPIGLFAFRFWLLLAIPTALISSLGLWYLFKIGKKISIPLLIILVVVIIGIFTTSFYQKYNQNHNALWPPGVAWTSNEELEGYIWLKNLPIDTKIFTYSKTDKFVIGFDKYGCEWCSDIIDFREDIINKNASQLYTFLKTNNYEYMIISGMSYKSLGDKFGVNETKEHINNLLNEISNENFQIAHQTQGMILFRVI